MKKVTPLCRLRAPHWLAGLSIFASALAFASQSFSASDSRADLLTGVCGIIAQGTAHLGPSTAHAVREQTFLLTVERARSQYPAAIWRESARDALIRYLRARQSRIDEKLARLGYLSVGARTETEMKIAISRCAADPDLLSALSHSRR